MGRDDRRRPLRGRADAGPVTGPSLAERVGAVVVGAAEVLPGCRQAAYRRYLAEGGAEALQEALPAWAAASGLSATAFRHFVVGSVLGEGAASALQAVGVAFAVGNLKGARDRLAEAVASESAVRWRYGLTFARNQAVYSAVHGLLP